MREFENIWEWSGTKRKRFRNFQCNDKSRNLVIELNTQDVTFIPLLKVVVFCSIIYKKENNDNQGTLNDF